MDASFALGILVVLCYYVCRIHSVRFLINLVPLMVSDFHLVFVHVWTHMAAGRGQRSFPTKVARSVWQLSPWLEDGAGL